VSCRYAEGDAAVAAGCGDRSGATGENAFKQIRLKAWSLDILSGQNGSERQRRSETEPKVGAQRLPWVEGTKEMPTPTGLCPIAPSDLMWAKPIDKT